MWWVDGWMGDTERDDSKINIWGGGLFLVWVFGWLVVWLFGCLVGWVGGWMGGWGIQKGMTVRSTAIHAVKTLYLFA